MKNINNIDGESISDNYIIYVYIVIIATTWLCGLFHQILTRSRDSPIACCRQCGLCNVISETTFSQLEDFIKLNASFQALERSGVMLDFMIFLVDAKVYASGRGE